MFTHPLSVGSRWPVISLEQSRNPGAFPRRSVIEQWSDLSETIAFEILLMLGLTRVEK